MEAKINAQDLIDAITQQRNNAQQESALQAALAAMWRKKAKALQAQIDAAKPKE